MTQHPTPKDLREMGMEDARRWFHGPTRYEPAPTRGNPAYDEGMRREWARLQREQGITPARPA